MGIIYIVGLGPGDPGHITARAWELLRSDRPKYFRTAVHPTVETVRAEGIRFESFDELYRKAGDFDSLYEEIVGKLIELSKEQDIVYVVPGSPLVAEKTVRLLQAEARRNRGKIEIIPGMSFLEVFYTRLSIDPIEGLYITDSKDIANMPYDLNSTVIITQVYSRQIASDVKLALMERYKDEQEVTVAHHLSLPDEKVEMIPLYELDRLPYVDHLTSLCIYPPEETQASPFTLKPLEDVVAALRAPDGCPWDRLQTHSTLRRFLLEEVYEVLEAIDREDMDNLREELGDVLLQIVFHARLAEEEGWFTLQNVIDDISAKMIRRHPHVFGEANAASAADVILSWEAIKRQEKGKNRKFILDGVSAGLPALLAAQKLQEKAAKVGFDWAEVAPAWAKVDEELGEFREALAEEDRKNAELEAGDVLFALINLLRWYKISGENALSRTNSKFRDRFAYVEMQVQHSGKSWNEFSLDELDQFWEAAKMQERAGSLPEGFPKKQE